MREQVEIHLNNTIVRESKHNVGKEGTLQGQGGVGLTRETTKKGINRVNQESSTWGSWEKLETWSLPKKKESEPVSPGGKERMSSI